MREKKFAVAFNFIFHILFFIFNFTELLIYETMCKTSRVLHLCVYKIFFFLMSLKSDQSGEKVFLNFL